MSVSFFFFFFSDTAPPEIYTLSLHDALPISGALGRRLPCASRPGQRARLRDQSARMFDAWRPFGPSFTSKDRKSTRLNSSHSQISYAVFCLKKKKKQTTEHELILAKLPITQA